MKIVQIPKLVVQIGINHGTINGAEKKLIFEYCGARETFLPHILNIVLKKKQ